MDAESLRCSGLRLPFSTALISDAVFCSRTVAIRRFGVFCSKAEGMVVVGVAEAAPSIDRAMSGG